MNLSKQEATEDGNTNDDNSNSEIFARAENLWKPGGGAGGGGQFAPALEMIESNSPSLIGGSLVHLSPASLDPRDGGDSVAAAAARGRSPEVDGRTPRGESGAITGPSDLMSLLVEGLTSHIGDVKGGQGPETSGDAKGAAAGSSASQQKIGLQVEQVDSGKAVLRILRAPSVHSSGHYNAVASQDSANLRR